MEIFLALLIALALLAIYWGIYFLDKRVALILSSCCVGWMCGSIAVIITKAILGGG